MKNAVQIILLFLLTLPMPAAARQTTQAAFSPSPQAIELVEKAINGAKHNVYVAAYSFTSPKVTKALIKAHLRDVDVRVVLDKSQSSHPRKALLDLYKTGVPIRINKKYAIMHNKYIIIDGKTVETGSFNFTISAERRNAENVIVIKNNPALAKKYTENWQKLWDEAKEYVP